MDRAPHFAASRVRDTGAPLRDCAPTPETAMSSSRSARPIENLSIVPPLELELLAAVTQSLENRLENFPNYPDLWNQLGLARAAADRSAEAAASFERSLAVNPRFLCALE